LSRLINDERGQFIAKDRLSGTGDAQSLPPGVTLTEIDGGETYYADNGFTKATVSFTVNGASYSGWDDPDWFPIATFLDKYDNSTHANRWPTLKVNTALAVQGGVDLPLMNTKSVEPRQVAAGPGPKTRTGFTTAVETWPPTCSSAVSGTATWPDSFGWVTRTTGTPRGELHRLRRTSSWRPARPTARTPPSGMSFVSIN
jgi:hypothetical protein